MTVGIPTYYGGQGLAEAAKSILASKGIEKFRFIVTVDGNPLKDDIRQQFIDLGVEVIENEERGGQVARIKQLIALCDTDILVLTQDDIRFQSDTLAKILRGFENHPETTMIGARMLPVPAKTFLEKVVERGAQLTHRIGDLWQQGDNYLLASGRCLAFRSFMAKKLVIPEEVINSDAYLYFENKKNDGAFLALRDAIVFNKSPQKIQEHIKQNKKFEYSQAELEKYLDGINLKSEYMIPRLIVIRALLSEFIAHPVLTVSYIVLQIYVKFHKNPFVNVKRFWDTDVSTKRV